MTNGSNVVSGVSSEDTARLTVGETVAHAALPVGTTVTAIGSGTFTVSNNATTTATGSIVISGTGSEVRNLFVVGDLASGSTTVANVSASDLAKLTVGDSVVHPLLLAGTTVASISTGSFTVSLAATGTQGDAVITGITTAWPSTDVINNLNQILRNDITPPGGTTTTWRYTYDLSGNTTSKTDGTNLTVYAWDEENRLTLVTLPDYTTIAYTYDAAGRLLTRRKSTDAAPTVFEWDGMDIVGETAPDGTSTRLYVLHGLLRAFERLGTRYEVHAGSQGHVHLITDDVGGVAYSATYDAWGIVLYEAGYLVGSWHYDYMGAWCSRRDVDTLLNYCLNRWLDTSLQRFESRDPLGSSSPYIYVENKPTSAIDPDGLDLILTGNELAIRRLVNLMAVSSGTTLRYTSLGNEKYSVTVDDIWRGAPRSPTARHIVLDLMKPVNNVTIEVVDGEPAIIVGQTVAKGRPPVIDIADVDELNFTTCGSQRHEHGTAELYHELAEALAESKQIPFRRRRGVGGAHSEGKKAANNYYRDIGFPGVHRPPGVDPKPPNGFTAMLDYTVERLLFRITMRYPSVQVQRRP
jgi:RHS repeat-associated protein